MEHPTTPRSTAVMPWLLLLCLSVAAHNGVLYAVVQPDLGFISIDCGLLGETGYVDNNTTLSYVADAGFIDAGVTGNISVVYKESWMAKYWNTLLSFPNGTCNCYTIGPVESGLKYLIRSNFAYGNYDGLNRLPIFELYVGVNFWTTVNMSSYSGYYAEAIVVVQESFVQVCLVNTGSGMPFINGLELRPLRNIYPQANEMHVLNLIQRFNLGPSDRTILRYPADPHDRLWYPVVDQTNCDELKTDKEMTDYDQISDIPTAVMQTAVTPRSPGRNLEFSLDLPSTANHTSACYISIMHFSELKVLPSNASRHFDINVNGVPWYQAYKPFYLSSGNIHSAEPEEYSKYSVTLNSTASSTLSPIINAIELFSVISTTNISTDAQHGYPFNLDFDFSILAQFQNLSINNLGDPFIESNYGVHSRQFEVAVLDWFARLWDIRQDEYWGYITNGGTEGNLHGLLVGREIFPDGVIYASRVSHYSVFKAARMYRVECVKIGTLVSGEMNYADFNSKFLQNTGKPSIVNVNIGTTVKGAIDDLDGIIRTLEKCGFRDWFYLHCDGALAGLMIAFIKQAPKVTFKKPIGSISVSGHKFMGCPVPCGVVITRLEHVKVLSIDIEYLSARDATITGSRNGHAPMFLWYTLNKKGYKGLCQEVQKFLRKANYLTNRLKDMGVSASLSALSSTVVFERPGDEAFVHKWQLGREGSIARVVVMPNVSVKKLDSFVEELIAKRSSWNEGKEFSIPCVANDIGVGNCLCLHHNKKSRNA